MKIVLDTNVLFVSISRKSSHHPNAPDPMAAPVISFIVRAFVNGYYHKLSRLKAMMTFLMCVSFCTLAWK